MRILLDANALASAVATRGLCADVLRLVLTSHLLCLSQQVLNELKAVLKVKFDAGQDLTDDFIWLLNKDAILAELFIFQKSSCRTRMI